MKNDVQIKEINSADLRWLHFPKEDVFFTTQEKRKRATRIQAIQTNKTPVHITFQDVEGAKCVQAVVKKHSGDNLTLHGCPAIPVHRILRVDQY